MNGIQKTILGMALTMLSGLTIMPGLASGADELPPPPYLVDRAHVLVVGVALDEATVKDMLPPGLRAAPGGTGSLVLYQAQEAYGLPPYSTFFIAADVEGYDTFEGGKARWMLSGAYSPAPVAAALVKHFGYPVREGQARIEWSGSNVRGTGTMDGKEYVRVELTRKQGPCSRISGSVNEITRNSANQVQVIRIPHAGDLCQADPVNVEVLAPAGDPFHRARPVKVLWAAELKDVLWAWSAPAVVR